MSRPELRPYQLRAIDMARNEVARGRNRVCIVMPTGSGKTQVGVEIVKNHIALGGRCLWVAHRQELIAQAMQRLREADVAIGRDCHVRTIQQLILDKACPAATLLILDEARHYVADEWGDIQKTYATSCIIGLDATPERGDGRGLAGLFDVLVEPATLPQLVSQGWLVPCDVVAPEKVLDPGQLAQDPLTAYLEFARGESAILFAPSVKQAIEYATKFSTAGIPARAVWGEMPAQSRIDTLQDYELGKIKVLCSVQVLTEGFDAPRTSCVILARGTSTCGNYMQMVGRALRPWPAKERAILIDLRGASHTWGHPIADRTWKLDGRAVETKKADVRFCPVCGGVVDGPVCERCGYQGETRIRPPRVLGLPMVRFMGKRREGDSEKRRTWALYQQQARVSRYKPYWAIAKYRAVYGEDPPRS